MIDARLIVSSADEAGMNWTTLKVCTATTGSKALLGLLQFFAESSPLGFQFL